MLRKILGGDSPGRICIIGMPDTGKTTLAHWFWGQLSGPPPSALVDCDPGQARLGPPAALTMAPGPPPGGDASFLRLVGAVSPPGHLLQMLTGVLRLVEKAESQGADAVVCDSSGFVTGGMAREFQFQILDALRPRHLVAIQENGELEPILRPFQGSALQLHRLRPVEAIRPRSQEQRGRRRRRRFAAHFRDTVSLRLQLDGLGLHGHVPDLAQPAELQGLLIAPCDGEGFALTLALLEQADPDGHWIDLLSPPFDTGRVTSLQFGSIRLRPDGRQVE